MAISEIKRKIMSGRRIYDCDTFPYWCSEEDYNNREKTFGEFVDGMPPNPDNFDCRRTSEPYCTGNYYCGPSHKRFGQNFFTWFTGNASWLLRAGFDEILGVKADFDGLRVAPKVPKGWREFSVVREFRDCVYEISFSRVADGELSLIHI